MQAELHRTSECLEGQGLVPPTFSAVVNTDLTVDAQLTVSDFGQLTPKQVMLRIEHCLKPVPRTWISVVLRFGVKTEEEREGLAKIYARYRGLFQLGTNYQHTTRKKIPTNFRAAKRIAGQIGRRGRHVVGIAVRLHWNYKDWKPERLGGEQGKGRGPRRGRSR